MNHLSRRGLFKAALMASVALVSGAMPALASASRIKTSAAGTAYNVLPDLENAAHLIYRVHSGPVAAIWHVYDSGVPLIPMGDLPNMGALVAQRIGPGLYATCKAEGRFRLGGMPFGVVTVDASASDRSVHVHTEREMAGVVSPERKAELRAAGLLI